MPSIEQEIFAIVKEKLAVNEVARATTLQELGADSLDVVEVLIKPTPKVHLIRGAFQVSDDIYW